MSFSKSILTIGLRIEPCGTLLVLFEIIQRSQLLIYRHTFSFSLFKSCNIKSRDGHPREDSNSTYYIFSHKSNNKIKKHVSPQCCLKSKFNHYTRLERNPCVVSCSKLLSVLTEYMCPVLSPFYLTPQSPLSISHVGVEWTSVSMVTGKCWWVPYCYDVRKHFGSDLCPLVTSATWAHMVFLVEWQTLGKKSRMRVSFGELNVWSLWMSSLWAHKLRRSTRHCWCHRFSLASITLLSLSLPFFALTYRPMLQKHLWIFRILRVCVAGHFVWHRHMVGGQIPFCLNFLGSVLIVKYCMPVCVSTVCIREKARSCTDTK